MQHHAPHRNPRFEGYYNKFDLASGSHIVLVISKVSKAKRNGNAFTFTYIPKDATKDKIYQKEIFASDFQMQRLNTNDHSFKLEIPNLCLIQHNDDKNGNKEYSVSNPAFTFHATTTSRLPWPSRNQTPEGPLVHLPLPLHWHVHSLTSASNLTLKISDYDIPAEDMATTALVHQEKNWASSFPRAHIWVQGRSDEGDKVFCCAGGEILGMQAFLIGYRSPDLDLAFRPPFALKVLGWGPFMSYSVDWENRTFSLRVQSLRRKIEVRASAPKGTFFPLAAPFAEGHRPNFLNQSLQARVEIKIYERSGSIWGFWRLVREDVFENGGLEFGGAYYPLAGNDSRFN